MTAPVSQAAVDAAMKALDCEELHDRNGARYCAIHHAGWLNDIDACVRAEAVAAAVVAAVQGPIKAEGVREAADEWQRGAGLTVMSPRGAGVPAIDYAQRTLDWLRDRADRIEAQS